MPQTEDFLLLMFYAGTCCVFLLLGLFLGLSRKPVFSAQTIQKISGVLLVLLAFHIFYLTYEQFLGGGANSCTLRLIIVGLDVAVVAACAYLALRKKTQHEEKAPAPIHTPPIKAETPIKAEALIKAEAPVKAETSNKAEEQPHLADTPNDASPMQSKVEEPVSVATTDTNTDAIEEDNTDEVVITDGADEAEDVEPIEEPNLEDMIFFQKVECLMAQKRLFCEQELSREDVAAAIGTNRTYLTRSIKSATGKTFLEYITGLRICYAATLLTTTNEPLDIIVTMVGFRSKSSYYRAFAAAYGCTPSEYRKR